MRQPVSLSHPTGSPRRALYGRDRERAMLQQRLADTLAGRGGLVLVGGEAGIGKTSLIRALTDDASCEGALVLTGACYDLTATPPYGPWIDLFSRYRSDDGMPPLPTVITDEAAIRRISSHDALFDEASSFLTTVSGHRSLVIVLEDLHWSDAGSLDFLRYLARQVVDHPLLIVATYRDTEMDRQHPLYQLMPALVRESWTTRVHLRPLGRDALESLVRARYRLSDIDVQRVVSYLDERAEGNPLFVEELLRTLSDDGVITATAQGHAVAELEQIPVPPLILQVIEGRLNRLDSAARRLLAVASIIGQDVPIELWQAACGADDEEISSVIRTATDIHVLEESPDRSTLRFTHALVREALYHDVDIAQRRSWHRTIGEILASAPAPEPTRVAHHFLEGRHSEAARWLIVAGERAQQLYAWRTAAERFESALPLIGDEHGTDATCGWLRYRIGLLLIYADPERGIEHLGEAERIAHDTGDAHLAAYARADRGLLRCLVGDVRRGLTEMHEGVTALDELPRLEPEDGTSSPQSKADATQPLSVEAIRRGALSLIGVSREVNLRQGALVFWLSWAGRYRDALDLGEPYVRRAAEASGKVFDALGDALAGLGHAYTAFGRPDEALDAFSRARDAYGRIDHHFKVGNTAIYELSEAYLPYRADRILERQWLAEQAEAG